MRTMLLVLATVTVVLAVLYAFVRGAREEGMRRRRAQEVLRDRLSVRGAADRPARVSDRWQTRTQWEQGGGHSARVPSDEPKDIA